MAPLVRIAFAAQQTLTRCVGSLLSLFFGACLFWSIRGETAVVWDLLILGSLVLSLAIRAVRRLRVLSPTGASRWDAEICTHLVVLVLAGILYSPGGLDGQYYPALYALVIVVAGFARPLAAAATVVYAIGLEASIAHSGLGREVESRIPHAARLFVPEPFGVSGGDHPCPPTLPDSASRRD